MLISGAPREETGSSPKSGMSAARALAGRFDSSAVWNSIGLQGAAECPPPLCYKIPPGRILEFSDLFHSASKVAENLLHHLLQFPLGLYGTGGCSFDICRELPLKPARNDDIQYDVIVLILLTQHLALGMDHAHETKL